VIGLAVVRSLAAATDPLGPVDQDPEQIRDTACKLVAPDLVCAPPEPRPPRQPPDFSLPGFLAWLGVAALVALLAWLAWQAIQSHPAVRRRKPAKKRPQASEIDDLGPTVIVDESKSPAQWRGEADEHRGAGHWREALRCRYRALVGDLARRGLIDEIPGRTTGEERVQLADVNASAADPFGAAADLFDDAWYGDRMVNADDEEEFRRFEAQVLQQTADGRGVSRSTADRGNQ
jgi:hypothetical protein